MSILKIINKKDLEKCWCCENDIITKSGTNMFFYDCLSCYDYSANISNVNSELIIYLHNILNFNNEFETTINKITLFENKINIIIEHESGDGIYDYKNYSIIKDTISIKEFKKLNIREFILKIIDNYKNNLLFL